MRVILIFEIYQKTDQGVRGWFPMSLPVAKQTLAALKLPEYKTMEADVQYRLAALAEQARIQSNVMASGGEFFAAAVIQSVFRFLIGQTKTGSHRVLDRHLQHVSEVEGVVSVANAKRKFLEQFPTQIQLQSDLRFIAESILLLVARDNPAMSALHPIFGTDVREVPETRKFYAVLQAAELPLELGGKPSEGSINLYEMLMTPILEHPKDLQRQVQVILDRWRKQLPDHLVDGLLRSLDILTEERSMRGLGNGPAETSPLRFSQKDWLSESRAIAEARFTPDRDWMSNVVIMAKQTYVWLDQLSKTYDRTITRLDEIPDEELDRLAAYGFTGLWLIGLWERSNASREIKVSMGNPDAAASAYSLYDYAIANDLGGDAAYERLSKRAWERGIRLAADMVPNHVGIDGRWVLESPDSFVQTRTLPYPNYQFNGPNLSKDDRVSIFLEDGYYAQSDAAVVFKRVDNQTQDVRYIYHGNDGTQMPWNDTAQLDYLNPHVREQVIEKILSVARKFPIIRFDAAMTLAKKHIQRLWYPKPGDGGAIPSRAQFGGISDEEFHRLIPKEFWREVVDRINEELPDTLLLAEAFWLMEGYFVRTLGMHRVYNSAFMNMLKREDNAGYRTTIKNTLAFSPEILKRFVNFMNNPDEETAVAQFGKGDKYLGNALLMVTMPGLPMFGHGQIEGFEEKYGMEYRRAYRNEIADPHLKWVHERYVAPLMHRRHLFSETHNFELFDFVDEHGRVDENVFAYTNRVGDERVLVLYNNTYASVRGRLGKSVGKNLGTADAPNLAETTAMAALNLGSAGTDFHLCEDFMTERQFIRRSSDFDEAGMSYELSGYQCAVFINFEPLYGDARTIESVMSQLGEDGHRNVKGLLSLASLGDSIALFHGFLDGLPLGKWSADALLALRSNERFNALLKDEDELELIRERFAARQADVVSQDSDSSESEESSVTLAEAQGMSSDAHSGDLLVGTEVKSMVTFGFAILNDSGRAILGSEMEKYFDESFTDTQLQVWTDIVSLASSNLDTFLLDSPWTQERLGVHKYEHVRWFSKDALDVLLTGFSACLPKEDAMLVDSDGKSLDLAALAEACGYRFDDFLFLIGRAIGSSGTSIGRHGTETAGQAIDDASKELLEGEDESEA